MVSAVVFSYFSLGSIKPAYLSTDAEIFISYPNLLDNPCSVCSHLTVMFRRIQLTAHSWACHESPSHQDIIIILYVFSVKNDKISA